MGVCGGNRSLGFKLPELLELDFDEELPPLDAKEELVLLDNGGLFELDVNDELLAPETEELEKTGPVPEEDVNDELLTIFAAPFG